MNKIITAGCMAVATLAAVAVPTKTELERAKPVVENMTKADLAAYTIVAMNRNIKDLPPAVIAEIVGDELRYVPDAKAPRLVAMLKVISKPSNGRGRSRAPRVL